MSWVIGGAFSLLGDTDPFPLFLLRTFSAAPSPARSSVCDSWSVQKSGELGGAFASVPLGEQGAGGREEADWRRLLAFSLSLSL